MNGLNKQEGLVDCRMCKRTVSIYVDPDDFSDWQSGKLAQNAFPYLSSAERELLISRTCGACFDEMFAEPAE